MEQVFGEVLLNDGVTFVLYEGVKELAFVEDDNIEDISVPLLQFKLIKITLDRWLSGQLPNGPDGRPSGQVHQQEGQVPQSHPQPSLCLPPLHDHSCLRIIQHPWTHCL